MEGKGPHGWGAPLHAAVLEATAVGPATTLLDLGCGTGQFARAATDRGARVTGIDLDPAAVARGHRLSVKSPAHCRKAGLARSPEFDTGLMPVESLDWAPDMGPCAIRAGCPG